MKKGKAQVLIDNFYKAAANPTAASSKKFIAQLTELQRKIQGPTAFHGAIIEPKPYTAVADELLQSTQSKTLMFGDKAHAMTAGVVFDGNKKSFFFYEPNYGMAYFPDEQSFQRGLNDIFTTKDFARKYPTAGKDPNVLEFKISPQDDKALLNSGVDPRSLEDLYTVPL
nr:YopT-type cysteine protease domain-containing protein [Pseudomonas yamanorum]